MKRLWSALGRSGLLLCTLASVAAIAAILAYVTWQGWGALSWEFLTDRPRKGMTAGGIFPARMAARKEILDALREG